MQTQSRLTKLNTPHISVVTPVYAAEQCLEELCSRLTKTLQQITSSYEIILVNDASPQGDWAIIKFLSLSNPKIKGINLSRNFGQHNAITAGIHYASGDWVVVMDCDLQDKPEEINKLYKKAIQGYDVVFAKRENRQDSFLKIQSSFLFYKVLNYLSDSSLNPHDHSVANFSIVNSKVCDSFRRIREQTRSYPMFISWLGYNTAYIEVSHQERLVGKSSYSLNKLLNLAFNIIITSSNKPLKFSISFGLIMAFFSFLVGLYFIINKIFFNIAIIGWTSIIVSMFFLFGLLFANLGIIGIYLGKVFEEVKNRPLYAIQETIGISRNEDYT